MPPKIFISYSWDDEQHVAWVQELAARLRKSDGLDVVLDEWATQVGDELTQFMEQSVRESAFVILVCTPNYKVKFDGRLGGVGYEARLIAGEIQNAITRPKIVALHRRGTWSDAAPSLVLGTFYLDFTGDRYAEHNYQVLVETLHGQREIAPGIGFREILFEGPEAAPAMPVANFAGRDEEMQTLGDHLKSADQHAVCVLATGVGGVGKTVLLRHFVATKAAQLFWEGAAWLDGRKLPSELARVSRRFGWSNGVDPSPQQANRFLAQRLHSHAVLLVVDNLPEDIDHSQIPLIGGKCKTLITSRAQKLALDLGVPTRTICLAHWPVSICRNYLRSVVPRLSAEADADLDALAEFVRGLPLAIRLIARALAGDRDRRATDHLARLHGEPLGALDQYASGTDRGIAATFLELYHSLTAEEQAVLKTLAVCAQGTSKEIVAAVSGAEAETVAGALDQGLAICLKAGHAVREERRDC